MFRRLAPAALLAVLFLGLFPCGDAEARNPFKRAFFDVYPQADGTVLSDVPSNSGHCGVCHFDFDGSAQRNPYGLAVEVRLAATMDLSTAVVGGQRQLTVRVTNETGHKLPSG